MGLKELQPALTIDEQITNLKNLGLIINDEDYAVAILNDISYFRLIKAYNLNVKNKNSNYSGTTSFEQLVELYLFDSNLRQLIFPFIERIEINLRCRISNYFSCKYGVLGYENSDNFKDPIYHDHFLKSIKSEVERNKKSPFVKNFHNNYIDGKIPMYALIELFTFGTLSKFYKNMKNADKKEIAKSYAITYKYLESWFENIAYVRNICAHYGRLYNAKLPKTPILYKEYSEVKNNRIYATILCIKRLVPNDRHWYAFLNNIEILLSNSKNVDKNLIGFPEDWKALLEENIEHNKQLITL